VKIFVDGFAGDEKMTRVPEDKAREKRIFNEIIVEAYEREDAVMCWLTHLEDRLTFPFNAECILQQKISPLRKGEKVTALELLDSDENIGGDFFVLIEWNKRKMGVPLAQLKPLKVDKETKQAIEDWQYWKARGHQF
jgi:hypothetical protein